MIRFLTIATGFLALSTPVMAQEMDMSTHEMHHHHAPETPATADTTSSDNIIKTGTDQPPGNAPAPPVRTGRPADLYYDPVAMARAEAAILSGHGGMIYHTVMIDEAEAILRDGRNGFSWKASASVGGDIDRFAIKTEGEAVSGDGVEHAEAQLLWGHALDPYWNLEAGIRQDFKHPRTYAALGVEGLAPYWIETEVTLFFSDQGKLFAQLEAHHDIRLSQKLIAQPRIEFNLAAQDSNRDAIGAGLTDADLGLRLRYEIVPEIAPYIGVEWGRKLGSTADRVRAMGDDVSETSLRIGLRAWF